MKSLDALLGDIRDLEKEITKRIEEKEASLLFNIKNGIVVFEKNVIQEHKKFRKNIVFYIADSRILSILTVPIIYSVLIPGLLMDLFVSIYQTCCFPIYGIQKVARKDHFVFDRRRLMYLNLIERANCTYCSYFNGLISFVREVASRTEQYWCPIRHAQKIKDQHKRQKSFVAYGDPTAYVEKLESLRKELKEL